MRFHLGPIPESTGLDSSWRAIREPNPTAFQLIAVPIGLATATLVAYCWYLIGLSATFKITVSALVYVLLSFPAMIVIHELLHAFAYPRLGLSSATIIGIWPKQLLVYAHHSESLTRDRFLVVFLMPFLVMTVLPLLLAAGRVIPQDAVLMAAWFSTWNALFACGDLLGVALIGAQVPRKSLVQNQGFRTCWRNASVDAA